MNLGWIFIIYLAERAFEIWLARRNGKLLLERGGREVAAASYRLIIGMHVLFWPSLIVESWPWQVPVDTLSILCLGGLVLMMGLRYWCIVSLGLYWNTRIIVVPRTTLIKHGPYRWLRHPNYLAVTLEFALLPLLMRAPLTLVLFSLANLVILRQRIALEEEALRENESKPFVSS